VKRLYSKYSDRFTSLPTGAVFPGSGVYAASQKKVEGLRNKLLVVVLLLAIVLVASLALSMIISSNEYRGIANTDPWTPNPTVSPTQKITILYQPTQSVSKPSSQPHNQNPASNCTHQAAYWASHQDTWPAGAVIGDLTYTKEEAEKYFTLAGSTAPDLFIQLHAAFLNFLSGADTQLVENSIIDAANWISLHPEDSEISETEQQAADVLENSLAEYNSGLTGPGLCTGEPTPTQPKETATPLPTATSTISQRPARTAAITEPPKEPRPKNPPKKTSSPHQPTQPPVNTPEPTSVPLPTQAPTQRPLPTPAPTSQ
jgi:hypothetical protein